MSNALWSNLKPVRTYIVWSYCLTKENLLYFKLTNSLVIFLFQRHYFSLCICSWTTDSVLFKPVCCSWVTWSIMYASTDLYLSWEASQTVQQLSAFKLHTHNYLQEIRVWHDNKDWGSDAHTTSSYTYGKTNLTLSFSSILHVNTRCLRHLPTLTSDLLSFVSCHHFFSLYCPFFWFIFCLFWHFI